MTKWTWSTSLLKMSAWKWQVSRKEVLRMNMIDIIQQIIHNVYLCADCHIKWLIFTDAKAKDCRQHMDRVLTKLCWSYSRREQILQKFLTFIYSRKKLEKESNSISDRTRPCSVRDSGLILSRNDFPFGINKIPRSISDDHVVAITF